MLSFWTLELLPYSFLGPLFAVVCAFGVYVFCYEMIMFYGVQAHEARKENRDI